MTAYIEELKLFAKLLMDEIKQNQFFSYSMDNYQYDMILTKTSELKSADNSKLHESIKEICNDILNIQTDDIKYNIMDNNNVLLYLNIFNFLENKCKNIFLSKTDKDMNTTGYLIIFMLKHSLGLFLETVIEGPNLIDENNFNNIDTLEG